MSERLANRTERKEAAPFNIEWEKLLHDALTMPGAMGNTYNRFYPYSMVNQALLYMQGVREPVNTYGRWQDMGRQVLRGSKAKFILRPIFYKELNDKGEQEQKVKGFKPVNCLFGVSETEGEELPEYVPKEWSPTRAMGALGINQVLFDQLNGNIQGYSRGNELAINPVAAYPLKTLVHEMGHIALGHTTPEGLEEYQAHRGIKEFEAEGTALLVMNQIGGEDQWNPAESRAYIQGWTQEKPGETSIRRVLTGATKIYNAGLEKTAELSTVE